MIEQTLAEEIGKMVISKFNLKWSKKEVKSFAWETYKKIKNFTGTVSRDTTIRNLEKVIEYFKQENRERGEEIIKLKEQLEMVKGFLR